MKAWILNIKCIKYDGNMSAMSANIYPTKNEAQHCAKIIFLTFGPTSPDDLDIFNLDTFEAWIELQDTDRPGFAEDMWMGVPDSENKKLIWKQH